jgi:hypothetical protein
MKFIRSALLGLFCCLSLPAFAAGTIFGLPLSQQFLENGEPMSGGRLYLYAAGTSTPSTAYESFGLTAGTELSHPIELDSSGRIPEFWVADGSYRVRLTDADGNEIFDINSTTALGASSGTGGGGSGDVSESSIFQTGDLTWQPVDGTRSGWVRANARTIGSSSSGATERANADAETLFLFLWNNFSNTLCPVSTGRGGSAAADWAANKTIATLDMRGRLAYGMDTMGSTAASVVAGATAAGGAFGQEELAITQANLPNVTFTDTLLLSHTHAGVSHTHDDGTYAVGAHTHGAGSYTVEAEGDGECTNCGGTTTVDSPGGAAVGTNTGEVTVDVTVTGTVDGGVSGSTTPSFTGSSGADGTGQGGGAAPTANPSGSVVSGGSGTAFDTLPPGRAGSWYFKL